MALFKIFKGNSANLETNRPQRQEGFIYLTEDDMKFYVDLANSTHNTAATLTQTEKNYRRPINASKTDVLQAWHTDPKDQPGRWTVQIPGITAESLVDGLTIRIRLSTSYFQNEQGYNTLNVNGLGAKLVYYRYNELLTNHVPQWAEVLLTYHRSRSMVSTVDNKTYTINGCRSGDYTPSTGFYANTNLGSDGWILDASFSDGNDYDRLWDAFENRSAGATVHPKTLCMIDVNGKIHSIVTTASEGNSKVADTTPFYPYRVLYYAGSSAVASGSPVTDLYEAVPIDSMATSLNASMSAYSDLYLCGQLNDQGMFVLDSTNYYVIVPNSIAIPANTFTKGKYYLHVGASDGTAGHMQLLPSHHFFYCADSSGKVLRPSSPAQDDIIVDRIIGVLPIEKGGTGLSSSPSMLVALNSNNPDDVLKASPSPGVTGVLPIANGGTGASSAANALKNFIGTTAIGGTGQPIYWDGSAFKAATSNGSLFSAMSIANNTLSITIGGINKTATVIHEFTSAWSGGTTAGPTLLLSANGVQTSSNVPVASASASGVITTGAQGFSGAKTFNNAVTVTGVATFNGNVAMNSSVTADSLSAGSLVVSGNTSLVNDTNTGNLYPHATETYNIGKATLKYNIIYATKFEGNASTADAFSFNAKVKLTGNVTGEASAVRDWTINTTIANNAVTNAMLAGSIANNKLSNSSITIAGNSVSLGGSIAASTLAASLGLSNAMHFIGHATVVIADGSTTDPVIIDYDFSKAKAGDVIIDGHSQREYVWSSLGKWELLGGDSSYKIVQSAVTAPTAETNKWVNSISQDTNGEITVSYTSLDTSGTWSGNAVTATKATQDGNGDNIVSTYLKKVNGLSSINWDTTNLKITQTTGSSVSVDVLQFVADGNITLTAESGKLKIKSTYTNSRDPGYGKIDIAGDTGDGAVIADTNGITAKTYNEKFTLKTGNKWLALSGTNSTSNDGDIILIGHSLSGVTAGSYGDSGDQTPSYNGTFNVPYITVDKAGHITAISSHTVKIPASDNTDTKVTQTGNSDDKEYYVLLKNTNDTNNETAGVKFATGNSVTINGSSGSLTLGSNMDATSKTSSASIKTTGGIAAAKRVAAQKFMVDDHVELIYDSTTQSLQFVFK